MRKKKATSKLTKMEQLAGRKDRRLAAKRIKTFRERLEERITVKRFQQPEDHKENELPPLSPVAPDLWDKLPEQVKQQVLFTNAAYFGGLAQTAKEFVVQMKIMKKMSDRLVAQLVNDVGRHYYNGGASDDTGGKDQKQTGRKTKTAAS